MKHILTKVLSWAMLAAVAAGSTSCLNEYLDKAPDAGLDEKEVFSKYANFKSYFNAVYNGANFNIKAHYPQWFAGNNQKFTMEGLTDMCDMTRIQRCQPGKQGDGSTVIYAVGYNSDASSKTAKVPYSWKSIRVANMAIRNIDMLQDATDREKKDLLAQAYFVRAYCHFELFRLYGSLPYIDKVMGSEDEWDLPRLSDHDMLQRVAADFQTAADIFDEAGLMRRDPASGSGHLSASDQDKPNGVTALAMKGRALLYAASPLSNPGNDISRWQEAAEANWTALKSALDYGYLLLAKDKYTDNFYGTKYTNEQLWAYTSGSTTNYNNDRVQAFVPYCFSNNAFSSGQCPTQNFVDKFETAGGWPLNTPEERAAATAAGQYNEQNPYTNRDPRFDVVVIYNQKPVQGYGNASIYVNEDGSLPSGSLIQKRSGSEDGVSETFYYEQKRTGALSNKGVQNLLLTDPIIRLGGGIPQLCRGGQRGLRSRRTGSRSHDDGPSGAEHGARPGGDACRARHLHDRQGGPASAHQERAHGRALLRRLPLLLRHPPLEGCTCNPPHAADGYARHQTQGGGYGAVSHGLPLRAFRAAFEPSDRLEERRHVLRAVPDERPAQNEELRTQRGVVVLIA